MRENKGITLIALIITIIVLLILVSVSIAFLAGSGIFGEAQTAASEMQIRHMREQMSILHGETAIAEFLPGWRHDGTVNVPALIGGTESVRYDGNGEWVITDPNNPNNTWYDYENQEWANARDANGNMFVWIPRFAYQVPPRPVENIAQPPAINVRFLDGVTNNPISGENLSIVTPEPGTGPSPGDWVVHPAFTLGSRQLQGIWVGKYTTGFVGTAPGNTVAPERAVIEPERTMWRNINLSNIFDTSRGFADANGIGGTSSLLRNRDWGAVAYLTHSRYGTNGQMMGTNSDPGRITGRGGPGSSSTGNATGIFDLRGGSSEYVAAYVTPNTPDGLRNLETLATSLIDPLHAEFVDVYASGLDAARIFNANSHMFGNAAWEVSNGGTGPGMSWFGSSMLFPNGTHLTFFRGRKLQHITWRNIPHG